MNTNVKSINIYININIYIYIHIQGGASYQSVVKQTIIKKTLNDFNYCLISRYSDYLATSSVVAIGPSNINIYIYTLC